MIHAFSTTNHTTMHNITTLLKLFQQPSFNNHDSHSNIIKTKIYPCIIIINLILIQENTFHLLNLEFSQGFLDRLYLCCFLEVWWTSPSFFFLWVHGFWVFLMLQDFAPTLALRIIKRRCLKDGSNKMRESKISFSSDYLALALQLELDKLLHLSFSLL